MKTKKVPACVFGRVVVAKDLTCTAVNESAVQSTSPADGKTRK